MAVELCRTEIKKTSFLLKSKLEKDLSKYEESSFQIRLKGNFLLNCAYKSTVLALVTSAQKCVFSVVILNTALGPELSVFTVVVDGLLLKQEAPGV